ncbi:hypothetical protein K470DRAFT_194625, partial [Piedraia hortae CBS 480.64]
DSIILAVDGACRNNGRKDAKPTAAVSVYIGPSSPYNTARVIFPTPPRNRPGILGLETAHQMLVDRFLEKGREVKQVVIKSDSEYLVKGMTEWIFTWNENG